MEGRGRGPLRSALLLYPIIPTSIVSETAELNPDADLPKITDAYSLADLSCGSETQEKAKNVITIEDSEEEMELDADGAPIYKKKKGSDNNIITLE